MNAATSLSSSMISMRTCGEPSRRGASGRRLQGLGVVAADLVDPTDRVAEAVDLDRVELRVNPAAERRHADAHRELELRARPEELDEIGPKRSGPDDQPVVVDDAPAMEAPERRNALDRHQASEPRF